MMIVSWSERVGDMRAFIGAAVLTWFLLGMPGAKAETQLNIQSLVSLCRENNAEKSFCLGYPAPTSAAEAMLNSVCNSAKNK
jgi:hypothetical protein